MQSNENLDQGGPSVDTKHHATIFRASFFTGGAQIASAVVSLLRNKLAAVTVGVVGVGIGGLLLQASNLVQAFMGLGIGSSGVRAIAAAHGRGDIHAMARAYKTLRSWTWFTGSAASMLCVLFSAQLSQATFGSSEHGVDFKLLGIAVLLQQLSQGQSALLRGLGRIKEIAALNVAAAVLGLLAAAPCYIMLGLNGLAPALVLAAAANLAGSWWHTRKIILPDVSMSMKETFDEGKELVRLGMAFVGVAAAGMAATYIVGCMIRSEVGNEGNGYYQAAAGISIVLASYVLSAMAQDYYPRLIMLIDKKHEAAKLMQDQTEMAVLMASPVLVAVSAFAPWLLSLAYSSQFSAASTLVTWLALGCLGRVVSWPLGFALLAEGRPLLILLFECGFSALSVLLAWIGLRTGGLVGATAAFAALYLVYWIAMSALIRSRIGFRVSGGLLVTIAVMACAILAGLWLNFWASLFVTGAVTLYCARTILHHLGPAHRAVAIIRRARLVARLLGVDKPIKTFSL